MTQKLKFAVVRVGNIVGKEENASYQHFLLFPQCFQTATFSGSLGLYGEGLNCATYLSTVAKIIYTVFLLIRVPSLIHAVAPPPPENL